MLGFLKRRRNPPGTRPYRSPFLPAAGEPLIVHGSHHKVGTRWFSKVLRDLAVPFGMKVYVGPQDTLPADAHIFIENHSRFDRERLPHFRGSHLIRDPRDVIVSAYHYHLWTKEEWANIPMAQLPQAAKKRWSRIEPDKHAHLSYREYLNSLDPETGLTVEMKRLSATFLRELLSWDYEDPRFIEVRYEDLVADEQGVFARIFEHYGLNEEAMVVAMRAVEAASFRNRAKREPGQIQEGSHFRSGKAGQWREEFTPEHITLCKALFGEALIQLGYEKGLDW